jgi:hypothetical protein
MASNELQPNDLKEGASVRIEWSPRGGRGPGNGAEGDVTRVWRPDGDVQEFTIGLGEAAINVYTEYRNPVVERVEGGVDDGEKPETETVGRLDRIVPSDDRPR